MQAPQCQTMKSLSFRQRINLYKKKTEEKRTKEKKKNILPALRKKTSQRMHVLYERSEFQGYIR